VRQAAASLLRERGGRPGYVPERPGGATGVRREERRWRCPHRGVRVVQSRGRTRSKRELLPGPHQPGSCPLVDGVSVGQAFGRDRHRRSQDRLLRAIPGVGVPALGGRPLTQGHASPLPRSVQYHDVQALRETQARWGHVLQPRRLNGSASLPLSLVRRPAPRVALPQGHPERAAVGRALRHSLPQS
jgi:hypothetical protein